MNSRHHDCGNWIMSSSFVMRMAGFPFDLLEQLAIPELAAGPVVDPDVLDHRLRESEDNLRRMARSDRFQAALVISNPAAFDNLQSHIESPGRGLRSQTKERKRDRTIASYLQRFCAKNDTTSFFGPVIWGTMQPGAENNIGFTGPLPADPPDCRIRLSYWVVNEVAQMVNRDPDCWPDLPVRQDPLYYLAGSAVRPVSSGRNPFAMRRTEITESDLVRLFAGADQAPTVGDLAQLTGHDCRDESFASALQQLTEAGALRVGIDVPVGLFDPADWLLEYMKQLPCSTARHRELLESLTTTADRTAGQEARERRHLLEAMETRFSRATGLSPRRRQGQDYADRLMFSEDCGYPGTGIVLGGRLARELASELEEPVEFFSAPWFIARREAMSTATRWFTDRFGPGARVPLTDYLDLMMERPAAAWTDPVKRATKDLLTDFAHLCDHRQVQDGLAVLEPGDLYRLLAKHEVVPTPSVCSVDVHLAATSADDINRGNYRLVIGDQHGEADMLSTIYSQFYSGEVSLTEVLAHCLNAACPGLRWLWPVGLHDNKICGITDFPGTDLEILGASPRPNPAVPGDLWVEHAGDAIRLLDVSGHPAMLGAAAPAFPSAMGMWLFALAGRTHAMKGMALPRIMIGQRLVMRRQVWGFRPDEIPIPDGDIPLLTGLLTWQQQTGLPRYVFVATDRDKPVYIDFHNIHLIRLMRKLVKGSKGTVIVSEMLPEPDDIWLSVQSERRTSEFRLLLFRKNLGGDTDDRT